jgi:predicted dehydrogenase
MEVEQFNRAIEGKGQPMTPAEDGLRSLAIRDALYDALAQGRVTRVAEYLPQRM